MARELIRYATDEGAEILVELAEADGAGSREEVEHPGAADNEVLLRAVLHVQHHATSTGTSAVTAFGPVVSRS